MLSQGSAHEWDMDVSREKNTSPRAMKGEGVRGGGAFGDLEIARNCDLKSQSLKYLPIAKDNSIHWKEDRVVETQRKRKVAVIVMGHEHMHYDINKMWKKDDSSESLIKL